MTERAQQIVDATKGLTLRPQQGDRERVIAAVIRAVADRLCTDWGELQHPYDVLNQIADEVETLGQENKNKPQSSLKFQTGETLYDVIVDWWEEVFTTQSTWDVETSISDLVDKIENWLPKPQSAEGSQNAYVESAVEGWNDYRNKVMSKLR